jgi:N-acetylglucosaminyldiphosphoundecaprenol N-acetyl-beta-D-mannosaminyltransferase
VRSVSILGVRVDDVDFQESLDVMESAIRERHTCPVVTPNPEFVMAARRDPEFARVLNSSGLAIPDGIGLMAAAWLLGSHLRKHVRGTDLVHELAARSVARGYRWFLLGAADGIAEEAADALRRRYPGIQIVGTFAGDSRPAGDAASRAAIQAAGGVDVVLVAYGAGAQERWMDRNLAALAIPVGIGVGGVLNFLAGRAKRAPAWVRRMELEWLHRLITQPWRWRRQLALPQFAALVLLQALRARRDGRGSHTMRVR